MVSRWVLQKQHPKFSSLSQGLNAAAKLIYIFLGYRLPLVFGAFSSNLHRAA